MLQRRRIICAITFAFVRVVLIDRIGAAGRHVGSILPVYPRLQPLPDTVPIRCCPAFPTAASLLLLLPFRMSLLLGMAMRMRSSYMYVAFSDTTLGGSGGGCFILSSYIALGHHLGRSSQALFNE